MGVKINYAPPFIYLKVLGGDWNEELEKIKSIPDRRFDPPTKSWKIKSTQFEDITSRWKEQEIYFENQDTEKALGNFKYRDRRSLESLPSIDGMLPSTFYELKPYQERYRRVNYKVKRMICSFPTGAGKTAAAAERIRVLEYISNNKTKKILIICPKRVKFNWKLSIRQMLGKEALVYWAETKKKRLKLQAQAEAAEVIICTYQTVRELHEALDLEYDEVIVDECHLCSNPTTKRFKDTDFALGDNPNQGRQLLSGTPIQHKPKDLWGPVYFMDPQVAGNYYTWKNRYERVVRTGKKRVPIKRNGQVVRVDGVIQTREIEYPLITVNQNLTELAARVSPYLFRVQEEEVFDFDNYIEPVFMEMYPSQRRVYNSIKEDILVRVGNREITTSEGAQEMLRCLQVSEGLYTIDPNLEGDSAKLDAAFEYIEDMAEDETVVFWTRFQAGTIKLKEKFPDKVVVLNGAQPEYLNQASIWAFNGCDESEKALYYEYVARARKNGYHFPFDEPGTAQVFAGVINILSSLGWDLHKRCHKQILLSFDHMGAVNKQTMARVIRLGQKNSFTLTEVWITIDSIENAVWQMSLENFNVTQSILDGDNATSTKETTRLIDILKEEQRREH